MAVKTLIEKVKIDRNIILYLAMLIMINTGFGLIEADFNLYILSMDMTPEFLGVILSLTPFTQALAAIPLGFLAEKAGTRKAFITVNLVVGTAYLLRVFSPFRGLILLGSFLVGTVQAGYFITQMPFINQYAKENKNQVYAFASISIYTMRAVGNLIGGFLPSAIGGFFPNETLAFRAILIGASILIICGTLPVFLLHKDKPADTSKISLSPYLHGMDRNTVRFAAIEFFLGTGLGFLMFFMNVMFVYFYRSNLQAYGTMAAIQIIPTIVLLLTGPALAKKFNSLRVIVVTRVLAVVFALLTVVTRIPLLGASAYVVFRAMVGVGTSLWLSFASTVATDRSRVATSAWLEITFQIGFAVAAFGGGQLIARDAYPWLGIISAVSFAAAYALTMIFFGKQYLPHKVEQEAGTT